MSIPAGRTKRRFRLSNHVDPLDIDDDSDDETSLLHVVHMVVPASSRYAAIVKGSTAARSSSGTTGRITAPDLVARPDDEPAQQLANQWRGGALPAMTQTSAETGQQLPATPVRRRPGMGADRPRGNRTDERTPFLYDEAGHGIEPDDQLTELLENPETTCGCSPQPHFTVLQPTRIATILRGSVHKTRSEPIPPATRDRDTTHQFRSVREVLDETSSGQPIWECRVYGTNQSGPSPTTR